jgi:hypothetical protein
MVCAEAEPTKVIAAAVIAKAVMALGLDKMRSTLLFLDAI